MRRGFALRRFSRLISLLWMQNATDEVCQHRTFVPLSLFAPKRLIIKPQSKHSLITNQIIERTRRYNPTVAVEYLKGKDFTYPVDSPREKFLYMKESVIISERAESFIRTFDSPGNIVESLTTVLNLSWMCANRCEFCYLQTNQTPEHYFYTNLRDAEHEIASSRAAHAAILTLWTHLSDYFGQRLMKLPDRFKETADWIRDYYVRARVTIELGCDRPLPPNAT